MSYIIILLFELEILGLCMNGKLCLKNMFISRLVPLVCQFERKFNAILYVELRPCKCQKLLHNIKITLCTCTNLCEVNVVYK